MMGRASGADQGLERRGNRGVAAVTRSKEMRRIKAALTHRNESELRWALGEIELRKKFRKRHSDRWFQIEKAVRRPHRVQRSIKLTQ
jgi:hypothetical protein